MEVTFFVALDKVAEKETDNYYIPTYSFTINFLKAISFLIFQKFIMTSTNNQSNSLKKVPVNSETLKAGDITKPPVQDLFVTKKMKLF